MRNVSETTLQNRSKEERYQKRKNAQEKTEKQGKTPAEKKSTFARNLNLLLSFNGYTRLFFQLPLIFNFDQEWIKER